MHQTGEQTQCILLTNATHGPLRATDVVQVLPVARVKTAHMDPKTHTVAADMIAELLPGACQRCEASLSRTGNTQSQSLYEVYARLQQLRGGVVAVPVGSAATSKATSKVR